MVIPIKMSDRGVKWTVMYQGMVQEGWSGNKIRSWMRERGYGYDQKLMVSDIRQVFIYEGQKEAMQRVPTFMIPHLDYVQKPRYTTVQERYAAIVTGKFENLETGEIETHTRTITFDSMLKKSEMVDEFSWVMADRPYPDELAFLKGEVKEIYKGLRK